MFSRLHHRPWHYLLLGLIGAGLFFTNLGGPSLWDLDEGRNAWCSGEMREAGNCIIPTFNGKLRPDKPVLLYWLEIAAFDVFGINEFAARLPSAVAALATLLIAYELGRSMFSKTTGLVAGIIAASTPMLCGAARFANPDALLNLFIVLTFWVFWIGCDRPRLWWFIAIGIASGLGMLAKGAVAVVLPLAIFVAFWTWQRRLRAMFDARQIACVLAFCLVALPWYIRVGVETKGEFPRVFFLEHHLDRAVHTMENHRGGIWYYPLVMILGTIPWAIFLGPAIWYGFWSSVRRPWDRFGLIMTGDREATVRFTPWWSAAAEQGTSRALARRAAAYRLLTCWIGVFLVFFTVSATKLPNYALPVIVPTAILMARFLERWCASELTLPKWMIPTSLASLVVTGAGITIGILVAGWAWPFTELRPWAALGLLPIGGAAGAFWCLRANRRPELIACVAVSGVLLLGLAGAYGVMAIEPRKPSRALVAEAGARQREQDIRVVTWQLEHLPSLSFYVQRHIEICEEESEVRMYQSYPLPVFVFLPASEWERLRPSIHTFRELARRPNLYKRDDVVVISNR
jgi:4-amino-4-deoxy-L-arabinose transferase-like glycosyltransferase